MKKFIVKWILGGWAKKSNLPQTTHTEHVKYHQKIMATVCCAIDHNMLFQLFDHSYQNSISWGTMAAIECTKRFVKGDRSILDTGTIILAGLFNETVLTTMYKLEGSQFLSSFLRHFTLSVKNSLFQLDQRDLINFVQWMTLAHKKSVFFSKDFPKEKELSGDFLFLAETIAQKIYYIVEINQGKDTIPKEVKSSALLDAINCTKDRNLRSKLALILWKTDPSQEIEFLLKTWVPDVAHLIKKFSEEQTETTLIIRTPAQRAV